MKWSNAQRSMSSIHNRLERLDLGLLTIYIISIFVLIGYMYQKSKQYWHECPQNLRLQLLQECLQNFRTTWFLLQSVIWLPHQLDTAFLYVLPHFPVFANFAQEKLFLQTFGSPVGYVSSTHPMKKYFWCTKTYKHYSKVRNVRYIKHLYKA